MTRVFISADLEGIAGVVHGEHTRRDGREHDRARRLMTAEVNAVIEGVFEAGAREVIVNDSHGTMRNLIPELLHAKALLISGSPKPLSMMEGIQDVPYTCAMFVGYHARMNQYGVLSHTYSGSVVRDVRLNGQSMGETGINAALAGSYGVPIKLVTGDDRVCAEARQILPGIICAEVKQAITRYSARSLHPEEACNLLRERAREAMAASVNPLILSEPVQLEISFVNAGQAEAASLVPGVEVLEPATLLYTGDNILQAFKMMRALLIVGGSV